MFKTSSQHWERCVTNGDPPRSLSLSTSTHGHRLILFGGVLDGEAHNGTHLLDTSESLTHILDSQCPSNHCCSHTHTPVTLTWSQPETSGTPPPVRCDHTSVTIGNKLYITCGSGSDTLWYSDLYTLDLGSYEWACVDVKGSPPVPRDCASVCVLVGQVSQQLLLSVCTVVS